MITITLGTGDIMISDLSNSEIAGVCFSQNVARLGIGEYTEENNGKTAEEVGAFLQIVSTSTASLDVLIESLQRTREQLVIKREDLLK